MKRVAIVTALVLALSVPVLSQTASAATYAIGSMDITGGSATFQTTVMTFDYIGPSTNLVGGYIGSGGAGSDYTTFNPSSIAGISNWFGAPASFYTAPANLGDINSLAGTYTGGPVPSGTLDNVSGTIAMDLSSWFANWTDGDYTAGTGRNDGVTSAMATGTWDPTTYAYNLAWDSLAIGPDNSPCPASSGGCITHWTLQGMANPTAAPVPVPAAIWSFGSGLFALFGAQWRKRNK